MSPATNWDQWGRCLRGVPFFSVKHKRAVGEFALLFYSNPTEGNRIAHPY